MEATKLKLIKPHTEAERATQTTMDTLEVTPAIVKAWKNPVFQRPLKVNEKVRVIADGIVNSGVIPGIVTLGVFEGVTFLIDGQHRREAFLISGSKVGYCDVRIHYFTTMAAMAQEFTELNSRISALKPDDILRCLEHGTPVLKLIRRECPFVGYGSQALSMSALLRCWFASSQEVPSNRQMSGQAMAERMTVDDAKELTTFLKLCSDAWGHDPEYKTLWNNLNLTLTAWMYRRSTKPTGADKRATQLSMAMFFKGLQSMSANHQYVGWLKGRNMSEQNRSPAYARIKNTIAGRVEDETGKKPKMPAPIWATHQPARSRAGV